MKRTSYDGVLGMVLFGGLFLGGLVLGGLFLGGLAGCSPAHRDRYPPAGDCTGSRCRPTLGVGAIGTEAAPAGDSGAPDGGSEDAVIELQAAVKGAVDPAISEARDEPDQAVGVSLLGFADAQVEVTGAGRIELPSDAFPGWLRVTAQDNEAKLASTLRWTEGTEMPLQLLTVDRSLYEDVAVQLFVPTSLEPTAGQLVLNIQGDSGMPVSGITLVTSSGKTAYDAADTFSDATDETGDQGAILWLNVPTRGAGVQDVEVVLQGRNKEQREVVPIEPGGLTVAAVHWTDG
jgi:hypothetical protein